jgi:hypothetical protein
MAAYTKFQDFVEQILKGKHDFSGHIYKVMLTNVAPAVTNTVKADLTEISAGNGYTAGGTTIGANVTETGGVATVAAADVTWTASGGSIGPFRYAVIYNDTASSPADALVGFYDYGSAITLADGESFTVDFSSNTLLTVQ